MEKIPIEYSQRDLLLMPFSYSNLSGIKIRPVIVVSNNNFNRSSNDLIVCCVTSNIMKEYYTVLLTPHSFEEGKLIDPCCIKTENIAKIEKSKVIKKIGKITGITFNQVKEKLMELLQER